jgi:glycosyltransferase involved in cell wall biosynthesis
MKLFVIPIEDYDLRYTEQWNRWFPEELRARHIPFEYLSVGDALNSTQLGGDVLDPIRTNQYRMDQITRILDELERKNLRDGDIIFFHTLWFPGLEALAYVRAACGVHFRIVGVLHAGSYDPWDFRSRQSMDSWSAPLEESWFSIADRILVASEFHRQQVLAARRVDTQKIFVTGLPFRASEIRAGRSSIMSNKQPVIAFPHRNVSEKSPQIVEMLREEFGDKAVLVTRNMSRTKSEYLDILASCKVCVSDSLQETFGYAMLEAAALECIPIVPDRLCYREMYPDRFRFSGYPELRRLVSQALADAVPQSVEELKPLLEWAEGSMSRMLDAVLSC